MVRIPLGNERSARIEVRSVAPDANPYMAIYTLLRTGLEGPGSDASDGDEAQPHALPARQHLRRAARRSRPASSWPTCSARRCSDRYAELKQASAERCPKALGTLVKTAEVQFHHEVTNQYLWNKF